MWIEYQVADQERRREIDALLVSLAVQRLDIAVGNERIVLDPPRATLVGEGPFTLGSIVYPGLAPHPVRLRHDDLLRHVFVLGPTGTGKSTLVLGLLLQFVEQRVPFMVLDFKRNYRCLLALNESPLVVLTVGNDTAPLVINALAPPPGVHAAVWVEALTDVIANAYLLLQGARNVLKEALLQACRAYGPRATLRNALELAVSALAQARSGSRRYGWLESAARSLEELAKGAFGTALTQTSGVPLADLFANPVVFELEELGEDQRRFFCLFVLQYVLLLRKHQGSRREVLQHVLVFDESHNVFPKDPFGHLSVPSRLAREVREYGEAVIAATQQTDVADSLIANAGIKIILRCDFPRDVEFASKLLQIDARWITKIPLGQAIARLPDRYYTPFLISFPQQPIKNTLVPDGVVRKHWEAQHHAQPTQQVVEDVAVSDKEEHLLLDIARFPISTITQRYNRLTWNPKTGNTTKDQLLTHGLAGFDAVAIPTGRIKILRLTPRGRHYLTSRGHALPGERPGGATHDYWRAQLTTKLEERGYTVEEERRVAHGTVDLHAHKEDKHVYVEIETGKSNVEANIRKCAGLAGVKLFFFTSYAAHAAHEELLKECPEGRSLDPGSLDRLDEYLHQ